MNRKRQWVSFLTAFALLIGMMAGIGGTRAEAAAKTIRSLKVMQGGKNIAKKTVKMETGTTKTLKIKAKPAMKAKNIKFKSSAKTVASVSAKGKLTAKKEGTAKISVTVKKKGYRKKTTWIKVSVSANKAETSEDEETPTTPPSENVEETPTTPPSEPAATNPPTENVEETPPSQPSENVEETPTTPPSQTAPPAATNPPEEQEDADNSGKILVAYFSWSGTSERIAKNIIEQTGADSFRIEREIPYSTDYNTVAYGDAQTEAETNARPPIKDPLASVAEYEKIVLCYPIWWHTAPMTVGTFLESYDLTGKTIYPISQSASMNTSQYEESVEFIRNCAKGAVVENGIFTKEDGQISSYIQDTVLKS